jgi:hypothetical protein
MVLPCSAQTAHGWQCAHHGSGRLDGPKSHSSCGVKRSVVALDHLASYVSRARTASSQASGSASTQSRATENSICLMHVSRQTPLSMNASC